MSQNDSNNNSSELGKKMLNNPKQAAKKSRDAWKNLKRLLKVFKFLKAIIGKLILAFGKWLLPIIIAFVIVVYVLVTLLMIVLDSVPFFDVFQLSNERLEVEAMFDETILDVFTIRQQEAPTDIKNTIRDTQPSPWPPISEQWLYETGEMMKVSNALPTIHHYYKNLKNENYKPWHKEYKGLKAIEETRDKFYKIIYDAFDYYFEDESYQPEYVWGKPPIDEYIYSTSTTVCTFTDEDGNTYTTESTSESKEDLPSRDIVLSMQLIYHKGTIHYKTIHTFDTDTTSSENCTTTTDTEKKLYVVNDSVPITLEFLPEELVLFLTTDAAEGKRTQLVQAQDLEYVIDLGKELDPRFPKPDIDYEGLTSCYFDKKEIPPCLSDFILGGILGDINFSGSWYPEEYEAIYKAAAEHCGIDWHILAAVHGMETGFGSNPVATDPTKGSTNANGEFVGALGHFQFMGLTWVGWNAAKDYETTDKGHIFGDISFITDPANIEKYGGLGMDANGDGIASPWDLEDAAFSAACYLKRIGYNKGDLNNIKEVLAKYNGGNKPGADAYDYADKVISMGQQFESGANNTISVAPGDITYPTTGNVTSGYGWRDIGFGQEFHYGIDIGSGGRKNVPIVSVADGVVTYVGPLSTWGNIVRVKHNVNGQEFETLYAHLASMSVKVGQEVEKGKKIGIMGQTGRATGVHLHFEVHLPEFISQAASSVNPLTVIPTPPSK